MQKIDNFLVYQLHYLEENPLCNSYQRIFRIKFIQQCEKIHGLKNISIKTEMKENTHKPCLGNGKLILVYPCYPK